MRFVVEACDSSGKLSDTFRMFAQRSMTPKTPHCPYGEQTPECWPEAAQYTFFDCASPMKHCLSPSPRCCGDARLPFDRVKTGDWNDTCSRVLAHGMTPKTPNRPYGDQTPECWPESAPYKFFDDCAFGHSSQSDAPTMPAAQRWVGSSSGDEDVRNPAKLGATVMPSVPAPFCLFAGPPQVGRPATQLSFAAAVQPAVAVPAAVAYSPAHCPYIQVSPSATMPAPGSDRDLGVPAKDTLAGVANANRLATIDEASKRPQERKQLPIPRAVYIDLSGLRCKT